MRFMETAFECWPLLPQYSQKIYVTGQKGACSATAGTRHLTLTRAGSGKKCWYQTFSKDYFKENFGLHIYGERMCGLVVLELIKKNAEIVTQYYITTCASQWLTQVDDSSNDQKTSSGQQLIL